MSLPRVRPRKREVGQGSELPTRAEYRGRFRTYGSAHERTPSDRVLKVLVVLGEYTRECYRLQLLTASTARR